MPASTSRGSSPSRIGTPPSMSRRRAFSELESLGALREADEAAALMRELGVKAPSGPRAAGLLTRREVEVLRLLGEGNTNVEIGKRLFISPKTVEHHVGRIYRKLDVTRARKAATYAVGIWGTNRAFPPTARTARGSSSWRQPTEWRRDVDDNKELLEPVLRAGLQRPRRRRDRRLLGRREDVRGGDAVAASPTSTPSPTSTSASTS